MSASIVARVRLGAALASVVAALMAAAGTSLVAAMFLDRFDDRRLVDAAVVLAGELDEHGSQESLEAIVAHELHEMQHTGIIFAIFDAAGATRVAGNERVSFPGATGCAIKDSLRCCAAKSPRGFWTVSAQPHDRLVAPFVWASLIAATVAGLLSWLVSRSLARWLTAPLTSLRQRLAGVEVGGKRARDLGPPSRVVEVDDLRDALATLMARVDEAILTAERFAADAAHELRTPLTAIRGELELSLENTAPARADIAHVRDKTIELQTLVERILMLALPEAQDEHLAELVAVDELASDVVGDLGATTTVELKATSNPAVVRGDGVLLATMLSNALGNALKFGTAASVDVDTDATSVVLTVSDNGPGVRPEMRETVFRPFVRDTQHTRAPGRGLGLAVVANIVRRHGGTVRFVDATRGAKLEIRLPRADAPQDALPKRA